MNPALFISLFRQYSSPLLLVIALHGILWPLHASGTSSEITPAKPLSLDTLKANAQGYVDSKVCASCHAEQYQGFQHVGMSQSFSAINTDWFTPEKLNGLPYYHQASQRYYDLKISGKQVYMLRYQLDQQANRVNEVRIEVDYLLGSGNKTTSLIFRTANDELFQLPLNWYAGEKFWGMAPGFEAADHQGLQRPVTRECMFCHNAYPIDDMDLDQFWHRDRFPKTLPNGIGCQRCHGPGEQHVKQALSPDTTLEKIHDAIVNPAKLDVKQRDSVCFQCHMQPAVGLMGVRRFDRTDYSFRPGESLSDYLVHLDITDANIPKSERFEINHHGYRLSNSECFTQSAGEMACISCHNPHEKLPEAQFKQNVEQVCWSCHEPQKMAPQHSNVDVSDNDCVTCHMPQRRSQDVIHAVMTDHRIGIYPNHSQLTKPIVKPEHEIIAAELLDPTLSLSDDESNIYKLSAILNSVVTSEYAQILKSLLQRSKYPHVQPYLDLAEAEVALKQYSNALSTLNYTRQKFGSNPRLEELRAVTLLSSNQHSLSEDIFAWLIQQDPEDQDVIYNYALLSYRQQKYDKALALFNKASALNENFSGSRYYSGLVYLKKGDRINAEAQFKSALTIDPGMQRAYIQLIQLFSDTQQKNAAKRYYNLGLRFARHKGILQQTGKALGLNQSADAN